MSGSQVKHARKKPSGLRQSVMEDIKPLTKAEIAALPMDPTIGRQLKEVPFLARLSSEKRAKIGGAFRPRSYKSGEQLITQGEKGSEFFILTAGEAQITYRDETGVVHQIASLAKGDYCGETALVTNDPRNATVTAISRVETLALSARIFRSLFTKEFMNVQFGHREAVCAETSSTMSKIDDVDAQKDKVKETISAAKRKSDLTFLLIKNALRDNILFRALEADHLDEIILKMWQVEVEPSHEVIKQADFGDYLYVIEQGEFGVSVIRGKGEDREELTTLRKGAVFGELALMYDAPRAATVTAKSKGLLWVVDRQTFKHILHRVTAKKLDEYEAFLRKVPILMALLRSERAAVADALEERAYADGEKIISQGENGDTFFIVKSGNAKVSRKEDSKDLQVLKVGDYFGERALLTDDVRAASVVADGDDTVCLSLNRDAFNRLLGPLKSILQRKSEGYEVENEEPEVVTKPSKNLKFGDMKSLGTLGIGAFGHVTLVQDKNSKITYALKSVSKSHIVNKGQKEHIRNERDILMRLKAHYFVNLLQTFNTKDQIHFLMEPALGGELFTLLRDKTNFTDPVARFYAATVVLAFEDLHSKHIIYRDLKPENLMIDENGYIKMTDFGFAKVVPHRTWTLCGTPDYLAPEMVSGSPHGKGIDWWTLGILIFEMLAGYPPFYASDQMKTYKKIIRGKIKFPKYFSKDAVDIIKGLCNVKPTKRLGVTVGGASAIKKHVWFDAFDWDGLVKKTLAPPIVQKVADPTDMSNFDDYKGRGQTVQPYVDDGSMWDADF